MSIAGKPILMKEMKVTGKPSTSALDAMTMLAEAPMRVPLPPKHAPKARAQARGSMEMPATCSTICCMMGTMVAVKGMLSTNAEKMAEAHTIRTMAKTWRDPSSADPTIAERVFAMKRRRPSSPTPSTTTKRAAKKRRVSHSTPRRASWQWCMSKATRSQTAPMMAIQAGSRCVTGCRKKEAMTHPSTTPHLMRRARLVMGYIFWSLTMSTVSWPLTASP
mmetsp:Transcript_8160/g.19006  ORF Transcript_8160/g.19006 Transcript_8160/m.19006 type:complete len:220 (-) Transcript_8160:1886-2545(-)